MSEIQFSLVHGEDTEHITVVVPGEAPLVAGDTHPNYATIKDTVLDPTAVLTPEELHDLFDVSRVVATRFERLTDRVTVANGQVYFDGDQVDDSLTQQIVRFLDEGYTNWHPLALFMENVQQNPQEHSRTQLFDWLNAREFTITRDGNIIGHKGVTKQADGSLVSGFTGRAIVNGEAVSGHIPNAVGNLVEMPRGDVQHDPRSACSTGLHVGTYDYAHGYANGALLKVSVNPRDVVSVPTDAHGEKVRVCRYEVLAVIDAPETVALDGGNYDEDDDYDDCGESY